jgi:hypothetical protein
VSTRSPRTTPPSWTPRASPGCRSARVRSARRGRTCPAPFDDNTGSSKCGEPRGVVYIQRPGGGWRHARPRVERDEKTSGMQDPGRTTAPPEAHANPDARSVSSQAVSLDANNAIYQAIRDYKVPPHRARPPPCMAHNSNAAKTQTTTKKGEGAPEAAGGSPRRPEHHRDHGQEEARG